MHQQHGTRFLLRRFALSALVVALVIGLGESRVESSAGPKDGREPPRVEANAPAPCVRRPLRASARAWTRTLVRAHTTVVYEVVVSSADAGCADRPIRWALNDRPEGFAVFATPPLQFLPAGASARFVVSVTATSDALYGSHVIELEIRDPEAQERLALPLRYDLLPAPNCSVVPKTELVVRDPSVVDDPLRTRFASPGARGEGAFTFGRLMREAAPSPKLAPRFVERFLSTWLAVQRVNRLAIDARPSLEPLLLRSWPRDAMGELDLERAPFRLLAIVNRLDLRDLGARSAGQLRFVFGALGLGSVTSPFTLILEYQVPATDHAEVQAWAERWHALGSLDFPSEAYNAALQELTERVVVRGATTDGVNQSALVAVRTNEIALATPWELRSFALSPVTSELEAVAVDRTPDVGYSGSATLGRFLEEHAGEILQDDYDVPLELDGKPFRGGSSLNEGTAWRVPNNPKPEVRRAFALNTCSGCHSPAETGTEFTHIAPRDPGTPSGLSGFMLGIAFPDPQRGGGLRVFNELGRRQRDFEALVCDRSGHFVRDAPSYDAHRRPRGP